MRGVCPLANGISEREGTGWCSREEYKCHHVEYYDSCHFYLRSKIEEVIKTKKERGREWSNQVQ